MGHTVLFQCLVMQIAKFKLEGKVCEPIVLVGSDSIKDPKCGTSCLKHGKQFCGTPKCDGSELLYDLKSKYLDSFDGLKDVKPTSFAKACKGNSTSWCYHDHSLTC